MSGFPWTRIRGSTLPGWARSQGLWSLLLVFAVIWVLVGPFHFTDRIEFDTDEGIELMKGFLVARGYPLYSEVSSNQTPLFTYAYAALVTVFGTDVATIRAFGLLMSSVLLWSCYQMLRMTFGPWHGLFGAVLVLALPTYLRLSVSAMHGLPAIALAVVALLCLALWHRHGARRWLVFSTVALGLSIATKLFTAFLAPIFAGGILLVGILQRGEGARRLDSLKAAVLWTAVFSAASATLMLVLVGVENVPKLLALHSAAEGLPDYQDYARHHNIGTFLAAVRPTLLLAVLGMAFAAARRRWLALYLAGWALGAYVVLATHVPVWYHHQLLVTLPAALLGGVALGEALRMVLGLVRPGDPGGRISPLGGAVVAILAFLCLGAASLGLYEDLRHRALPDGDAVDHAIVREMSERAGRTRWAVTDRPMLAFRAGLPVPPPTASISDMHFRTGALSEELLIRIIREYRPEQVLLARFRLAEVRRFLDEGYVPVFTAEDKRLYVRRDPGSPRPLFPVGLSSCAGIAFWLC